MTLRVVERVLVRGVCGTCGQVADGITSIERRPWSRSKRGRNGREHRYHRCHACLAGVQVRPLEDVLLEQAE